MIDPGQTIISQYGNAPTLRQLIESFNGYIDQTENFAQFYAYIWNVETAQGFGLDILGRIVDVSRRIQVLSAGSYFGFKDTGNKPFGQAPFYNGASETTTYTLTDEAYRVLIMVKALANISATNAPTMNGLLQKLFDGRGRCWTNDLGGMKMRYVFEFELTPYERAILVNGGVLPHPAGVQTFIVVARSPSTTFGFKGSGCQPFGQGTFRPSGDNYAT